MCPTDKPKAHREAVYWDTLRSRPESLLISRPVKSYRQAKSPPGYSQPRHAPRSRPRSLLRSRPLKSTTSQPRFYWSRLSRATMKLTGWSPKRTSKDDYRITQHLQVNAIFRGLPAGRDNLQSMRKHCMKVQESAGALQLGKYNHFRETYVVDIDE